MSEKKVSAFGAITFILQILLMFTQVPGYGFWCMGLAIIYYAYLAY